MRNCVGTNKDERGAHSGGAEEKTTIVARSEMIN